jgi:hypothetical protein
MTNDNFDDYPLLETEAELDEFLGRIRNKEGRIVKYASVQYNKRSAKRVIDDMEYDIDRCRKKIAATKNRLIKNRHYAHIEGSQRIIKYASTFIK